MLAIFIGLCSIKYVVMAIIYAKEGNWKGFWGGLAIALTGALLAFLVGASYMLAAKMVLGIIAICFAVLAVKCFQKKNKTIFVMAAILTALLVLLEHLL